MTERDIIRLAREAGYGEVMSDLHAPALERFFQAAYAAGAAAERERIAKWFERKGYMVFPVAVPDVIRKGVESTPSESRPKCKCLSCWPFSMKDYASIRVRTCPECGNKRCPQGQQPPIRLHEQQRAGSDRELLPMSYCRFSSNDFQCDVYVYADVSGGWTTHVKRRRHVGKTPIPALPPRWWEADPNELVDAMAAQQAWLDSAELVPIGLSRDGQQFSSGTPGECADLLEDLMTEGYIVPWTTIKNLRWEQFDIDHPKISAIRDWFMGPIWSIQVAVKALSGERPGKVSSISVQKGHQAVVGDVFELQMGQHSHRRIYRLLRAIFWPRITICTGIDGMTAELTVKRMTPHQRISDALNAINPLSDR